MSRKPETPGFEKQSDDDRTLTYEPGPRYTSNKEILEIERELVADGVDLPNRAIPSRDRPENAADVPTAELRDRIEREAERDRPNKRRIAHLNKLLTQRN